MDKTGKTNDLVIVPQGIDVGGTAWDAMWGGFRSRLTMFSDDVKRLEVTPTSSCDDSEQLRVVVGVGRRRGDGRGEAKRREEERACDESDYSATKQPAGKGGRGEPRTDGRSRRRPPAYGREGRGDSGEGERGKCGQLPRASANPFSLKRRKEGKMKGKKGSLATLLSRFRLLRRHDGRCLRSGRSGRASSITR